MASTVTVMGCMGCNSVCRCDVERVAYTLQIIAQNGLNPTLASMIMSLESVFSVLAGWVILGEVLTARQLLGCLLIFIAIIFAQIPVGEKKEA